MKYLLMTAFVGMLAVSGANAYSPYGAYIAHYHYYHGFGLPFEGAGITRPIHRHEVDMERLGAVHPEALRCNEYSGSCY